MPEFFGPLSRSAFLVNKKSLFLQKCQCIELLTFFRLHIYSILYSIYSIFSSKLAFKFLIFSSEKKGPSCPKWGQGGVQVIRAMPERKRFFSVDVFPKQQKVLLSRSIKQIFSNISCQISEAHVMCFLVGNRSI